MSKHTAFSGSLVAAIALMGNSVFAQDNCPNRGALDEMYCDANGDLVADALGASAYRGFLYGANALCGEPGGQYTLCHHGRG